MLKYVKYLSLILMLISFSAFASESASYFYVQASESATLQPVANKTGVYTLTLKKVQPYIHYMSDRPNRMTGLMSTDKFYNAWYKGHNSFAKDAPNVSLSGMKLHGVYNQKLVTFVIALTNPTYNPKKEEITYEAKALGNEGDFIPNKPVTLQHVVLFLDSGWCPSCCCG